MSNPNFELFFKGDAYFQALGEHITNAKNRVWLESYIFDLDPIGLRLIKSLSSAKKRGVDVRIMVDGIGSFNWLNQLEHRCLTENLSFRSYHPLPRFAQENFSWKGLRRWLLFFKRMNKRNHRKIALIDDNKVFVGSFNISQVHSQEFMGPQAWRDSGALVTLSSSHPELRVIEKAFLKTWSRSRSRDYKPRRFSKKNRTKWLRPPQVFRLNQNPWWRFLLNRNLKKKFRSATKRIWITNAYFVPRGSIVRLLKKAARKQVEVKLLLPKTTDVWFVRQASLSLYSRLLKAGVRIFEYQVSVLHAKTMLIDDWASVGSHNLNHRSLLHDLEIEVGITDTTAIESLQVQWEKDLLCAKEVKVEDLGERTFLDIMISRIFWWLRYWL